MEFSEITKQYWEERDWSDLEKAEKVSDLYIIAKRIIDRMPKPLVGVCGPVATGGLGSIEANLDIFNRAIHKLQDEGLSVFDQMPFEGSMQRLKEKVAVDSILTDFYSPLFESGLISTFYFLPNWQTSTGSKWEHEKAKKLGVKIVYL